MSQTSSHHRATNGLLRPADGWPTAGPRPGEGWPEASRRLAFGQPKAGLRPTEGWPSGGRRLVKYYIIWGTIKKQVKCLRCLFLFIAYVQGGRSFKSFLAIIPTADLLQDKKMHIPETMELVLGARCAESMFV